MGQGRPVTGPERTIKREARKTRTMKHQTVRGECKVEREKSKRRLVREKKTHRTKNLKKGFPGAHLVT